MSDLKDQLRGLADTYGRGSHAYASVLDPTLEPMARVVVELAAISPGYRVLDLASGTGLLARAAAAAGAWVVAGDLAVGMMRTARAATTPSVTTSARTTRTGTFGASVGFLVADAGALPLGAATFHVVTCGLSLSHFPDLAAVGGEVRRVLREGGTFVGTSWGSSGRDPSYAAVIALYRRYAGGAPRPFSRILDEATWTDPDRGREALERAGFGSTDVATRHLDGRYADPAAALEWALAWPLTAGGVRRLDAGSRRTFHEEALGAIEEAGDLDWTRSFHVFRSR